MNSEDHAARWPVLVALGMLVLITLVFLVEFLVSTVDLAAPETTPEPPAPDAYLDVVEPLLAGANPEAGAALVEKHNCVACHRAGVENRIAPPFAGLSERAAGRKPPLTAEAYIYESITHPTAFVVEGFSPAMPQNYPDVLMEDEIGDIIAFLLTPGAY